MLYLVDVNAPCIFEMIKNKGHGFFTVLSFPGTTVWHCGATHSPQHNWIHQYLFIMRVFFFVVLIPKPQLWGHKSSTVVFLGDRLVPFKRVQAASHERYEFFRGNIRCNCFIFVGKFPSFPSSELFEELRGVEGAAANAQVSAWICASLCYLGSATAGLITCVRTDTVGSASSQPLSLSAAFAVGVLSVAGWNSSIQKQCSRVWQEDRF